MAAWRNVLMAGLLVTLGLAGCLGEEPVVPEDGVEVIENQQLKEQGACPDSASSSGHRFWWSAGEYVPGCPLQRPPAPGRGTSFTYRTGGVWDLSDTVTVVVQPGHEGLLFAAGAREQLYDAAVWWRHHLGPHDRDLNALDDQGKPRKLFDWPLFDNKTWTYGESIVTAREEQVPVPGGKAWGFRMHRSIDGHHYEWTYAPSVGYLTTFRYWTDEWTYEELIIEEVGTHPDSGVWMERGPYLHAGSTGAGPGADPGTWTVPPGYDEIVLIGLGAPGARGVVVPPKGHEPWTFETDGLWAWQIKTLPAEGGDWHLVFAREDGWVGVEARPIKWLGDA